MFEQLKRDMAVLTGDTGTLSGRPSAARALTIALTKAGVHAVVLYRLSHFLATRGHMLPAEVVARLNFFLTGADIDCMAEIGYGLRLGHTSGVVIGRGVKIGNQVSLLHNVTLGGNGNGITGIPSPDGYPTIEDGVWIFTGAKVLGPVTVGRNSCVLADTIVSQDVPPDTVYGQGISRPRTGTFNRV